MKAHRILFLLTFLLYGFSSVAQSVTAVYTAGNSSTDRNFTALPGNSACPIPLSVTIPAGAVIIGTDVSYSMTAAGSAWMSEQRSQLRCISPGGIAEPAISNGFGNATGTYAYNRTGLNIANGVAGGGTVNFQLHAGRTFGGTGCGTTNNRVNNNWSITVHYVFPEDCQGTPSAGFVSLNRSAGCEGVSVSLTANSNGFTDYNQYSGVSYQWQSSPNGSTGWTNIPGATSPEAYSTIVSSTIYYRLVATCSFSGQQQISNVVSYITSNCEEYLINEHTTVNTCQGLFYDSGGPTGNYGNNETHSITFCAANGEHVQVEFLSFNTETNGLFGVDEIRFDILNVFDGPNSSSPQMFSFAGVSSAGDPVPLVISSGSCLTFVFTSNGTNTRPGWEALVTCTSANNNVATNFCGSAPNICNLNGYVGSTSNFYNVENVNGQIGSSSSLFPSSVLDNNSFITFTPTSSTVTLDLLLENCSGGTSALQYYGIQFAVYSGTNCSNFTLVSPSAYVTPGIQPGNHTITLNNLNPGQTYYIMTDGLWGAVCHYTINVDSGIDLPTLTPEFSTVCAGESVTLSASGGISYLWNGPGIAGVTGNSISASQEGTYQVTVETGNPACPNAEVLTANVLVEDCGCEVTATNSGAICPGDEFLLEAVGSIGAVFEWSGPGVTGLTGATLSNLTNLVTAGIYQFDVTATVGGVTCTASTSVTVLDAPQLTLDASQSSVCAGESVELIVSGGTSYNWGHTADSDAQQTVMPVQTTTYVVTDQSVPGCPAIASLEIVVHPQPNVLAGNDVTICAGESVVLNATGADNYTWSNGFANGQLVTPEETTTYAVTGTTAFGCQSTDEFTVNVEEAPDANHTLVASNLAFCQGENAVLTAGGGDTYLWSGAGVTGVTSNSVTVNQSGVFSVTITSGSGNCAYETTESVTITVYTLPLVNAGPDMTVCIGEAVTLTATGASTFTWDNSVQNGSAFIPSQTQLYTVIGVSEEGCAGQDEVLVTVVNQTDVSFGVDELLGCAPLSVQFVNTTEGQFSQCLWDFGDGTTSSSCGSVSHVYMSPGCYDVSLAITNTAGCAGSSLIQSMICVEESPVASFSLNATVLDSDEPTVQVVNTSSGATSYFWTFGDGSGSSSEFAPTYTYGQDGVYTVWLIAYSESGCKDSTSRQLEVREELIYYVPNAFTPDGNKFNEVFLPVFTSGFDPYDYSLQVFNRWGELVFESRNHKVGWNGMYNGQPSPDGVYVWKIRFGSNLLDEPKELIGHVSLMR